MEFENVLKSSFEMNKINQEIIIYDGEYILEFSDCKIEVTGKIIMKWLPTFRIEHQGRIISDGNVFIGETLINKSYKEKVLLKTKNGYICNVNINKVDFTYNHFLSGSVVNEIERVNGRMDCLNFSVVNFLDNLGYGIASEKTIYSGRIIFEHQDFKIIFDKLADYKEKYEELNSSGGYVVTHVGRIENIKGNDFDFKEVENYLESLTWLLSFASGRQVGICANHGFNKRKLILEKYQTPIIAKWKRNRNWFPRQNYFDSLETIFPLLVEKLDDELWGKVLKNLFTWYFESLSSTYVENKIVAVQIALEMLAWTYLVEEHEIINGNTFEKNRASDNFRLLFEEFSISKEIPNIEDLRKYRISHDDGAHLLTDFRNSIVHPKKVNKHENMPSLSRYQILQLGIKYLELSILKILNYQGQYHNLLSEKDRLSETLEHVPWYSPVQNN